MAVFYIIRNFTFKIGQCEEDEDPHDSTNTVEAFSNGTLVLIQFSTLSCRRPIVFDVFYSHF